MASDERTLTLRNRIVGLLGPVSSSFTLAWLATHRGRLHSAIVGCKRITLVAVWDSGGSRTVTHSDAEVDALRQIVYGDSTEERKRG